MPINYTNTEQKRDMASQLESPNLLAVMAMYPCRDAGLLHAVGFSTALISLAGNVKDCGCNAGGIPQYTRQLKAHVLPGTLKDDQKPEDIV